MNPRGCTLRDVLSTTMPRTTAANAMTTPTAADHT